MKETATLKSSAWVNVFSIESTMENDLFAEAYAKEVVSVIKTTIRFFQWT